MSRQAEEGLLARMLETMATWRKRTRDRHLLAQMSERQRCDIGLSRDMLDDEIGKPFWRA